MVKCENDWEEQQHIKDTTHSIKINTMIPMGISIQTQSGFSTRSVKFEDRLMVYGNYI